MRNIVSLFDESGNMGRPWAEAGYSVYCFDILNKPERNQHFPSGGGIFWRYADLDNPIWVKAVASLSPCMIFSFSPCDDVAVSGSLHFAKKLAANPDCQRIACNRARLVEQIATEAGCAWMHENPVSVLSTMWRKPDFHFHPSDYGGYLPEDDVHPRWPEYIAPRDAYPKKTGIRCGGGFIKPAMKPVERPKGFSTQFHKLGGKSAKTKQIRSETPRGFALAVFEANQHKDMSA